MANLTIEVTEDLARRLRQIAAAQHKSVQELALERLRSFAEARESPPGSAAAVLHAMQAPPCVDVAEIDELEAAIAAGRLPVPSSSPFPDDRR